MQLEGHQTPSETKRNILVTFDSFVSKAYELAPQGVDAKGGSAKVGILGDHVVKVGFFDRRKVNVAETKRQDQLGFPTATPAPAAS